MVSVDRIAVHELGHAAIALLLGRDVQSVELGPTPSTKLVPRTLPRGRPNNDRERAALEAELMIAVAGVAAERVCSMAGELPGALDDLGKAAKLALQLAGPARAEATVSHFLSVVERLLTKRRGQLTAAAEALRATGRLDGPELRRHLPREG